MTDHEHPDLLEPWYRVVEARAIAAIRRAAGSFEAAGTTRKGTRPSPPRATEENGCACEGARCECGDLVGHVHSCAWSSSFADFVTATRPDDPPAWCHGGSDFDRLEPRCTIAAVPHGAHLVEGPRP